MAENPLGYEKISKLLKDFAIPSIMASLVGSIYNIVDQIFIGQGVGYLGNAATNVAYPFSTICLAIALLVGIGSASRVSLCLGRKEPKAAAKAAGNGIVLMGIFGIIYLLVGEAFLSLLLKAFGATTDVFPYAKQYASITLIGMPFLIVTNGMSNLIRADGKPKYSMVCMVMGAIINTILDPIFIFACDWGIAGGAWATVIGQIFSFILALRYLWRFQTIHFEKESFLRRINKIWNRYSLSCLRNRYENKCHNPCDCCRNLAGNTADYRLQLWGKAIPSCTGGLPACGKMEPCCFHNCFHRISIFPTIYHFAIRRWGRAVF
ncbi:MAG: hypothetical protein BHV92_00680 [Clostridiales bacterium 45_37]|nr:MAG: hypothetical protein BHV92_00680 [Clostridiales bacterium 45_37]